jgi:hypothetical protein
MQLTTALALALCSPAFVESTQCRGQTSPQLPQHLSAWNVSSGSQLLDLLEKPSWYVVSTINWFEEGWRCFRGNFSLTEDGQRLTCAWQFEVPVLRTKRMVDQLSFSVNASLGELSLRSLSMPEWLRKLTQEDHRPVRVLEVSLPPSLDWAVLFDCGNALTPSGELFILSRQPRLDGATLAELHELVRRN